MSYDITLEDDNGIIDFGEPVQLGGTYAMGNTKCDLNITYNYCKFYYTRLSTNGIKGIDGIKAKFCINSLENTLLLLADDVTDNYWDATEGNAKRPIQELLRWAKKFPEGVFRVT